jgi:hypothetical protein
VRTTWISLLVLLALGVASCTGSPMSTPALNPPKEQAPADLLFLATGAGMQALDPSDGRVLFQAAGVVPSPDWSVLVTSSHGDGSTSVRTLDPSTGETQFSRELSGDLVTSAVSGDGLYAALVDPGANTFPAVPDGRAFTHVAVAGLSTFGSVQRFRLRGNFQPEAFSPDASRLFLIKYLPAMAPERYRVMSLDLLRNRLYPAFGRTKFPTGTMTGTRVMHVFAPAGDRLYTLYTNQPSAYSEADESGTESYSGGTGAYGSGPAHSEKWSVAFVHTLFLDSGLAICVNLPKAFGTGPARAKTLAVSADGTRLYAIDTDRNLLTELRTRGPRVATSTHVDFGPRGDGTAVAATAPDGTLYVGWNHAIVAIDGSSLTVRQRWQVDGRVTGLALGADGKRLYVAFGDRIMALDPSTGDQVATIPTPGVQGISFVGSAS